MQFTSLRFFWHILRPNWQLVATQWDFEHSEEFRNRGHFPSMAAICRFLNTLQRIILGRIIDRFGHKMYQKKREDVGYKLLYEIFQKYFVIHEQSDVKNSFSTYVVWPGRSILIAALSSIIYSKVSNKRTVCDKRAGGNFFQKE